MTKINLAKLPRTKVEADVLETEVEKLLKKGVISPTKIQPDDYFSNLFARQKKDGSYRTILNFKYLNQECYTQHFNMESIRHAIYMLKSGMLLAFLDNQGCFLLHFSAQNTSEDSKVFAKGKSTSV